jgi:hypothetical protein
MVVSAELEASENAPQFHFGFVYSDLAAIRTGISGSATFLTAHLAQGHP